MQEVRQARDINPREKRDPRYLGILGELDSICGVPRIGNAQQGL